MRPTPKSATAAPETTGMAMVALTVLCGAAVAALSGSQLLMRLLGL